MRCVPTALSDIWKIRWLSFMRISRSAKLNLIITPFSTTSLIPLEFSKNTKICRILTDSRVKFEKFNSLLRNALFFVLRDVSNSPCCQLTTQRVISHSHLTNSIWTVLIQSTRQAENHCVSNGPTI